MSIDVRTRCLEDVRSLDVDHIFDLVLPDAIRMHGDLAARGLAYQELPPLAFEFDTASSVKKRPSTSNASGGNSW